MNILLSGYFGFNNFGDEAILKSAIDTIKSTLPNSTLTVLSHNPIETSEKYLVNSFYSFDLKTILKKIKLCDYLIFPGGSVFQNATSTKSLFYYLFLVFVANFYSKKVILLSQGIGPIYGKFQNFITKNILKNATLITVRDKQSFEFLNSNHINTIKTLDLVWNIDCNKQKYEKKKKILGIQLRKWKNFHDEKINQFAAQIIENFPPEEFDYQLISLQKTFDLPILEKLAGFLKIKSENSNINIFYSDNLEDIISMVINVDYLIAMRFHAGIIALKNYIPLLFISYDIKIENLANELGLKYIDIKKTDFSLLNEFRNKNYTEIWNNVNALIKNSKNSKELLMRELTNDKKRAQLLNVPIDIITLKDACNKLFDRLNAGKSSFVITINPEMVSACNKNNNYLELVKSADFVVPDGIGVVLGLKTIGIKASRVAGVELAYNVLKVAGLKQFKVALIGATQDTIEKAKEELEKEISGINIVYSRNGYFNNLEEDEILSDIVKTTPDILLCALGFPKQELFISKFKKLYDKAIMIGVGGSFDVWSKKVKRAPAIFQKLGMEWFYRLICQPSRFKRIFPCIPIFLLKVLFCRNSSKKNYIE